MRRFDDGSYTIPSPMRPLSSVLEADGILVAMVSFTIDEKVHGWSPPKGKEHIGDITISLKCRVVKDAPRLPFRSRTIGPRKPKA